MPKRSSKSRRDSVRKPASAPTGPGETTPAKPSETLRIAITLPRPSGEAGPVRYGARLSSGIVKEFLPDERTVGRALEELQRRGFAVSTKGRASVSVRGARQDFERLFGTKLSTFRLLSTETTRYSASAFYYPPAKAPWAPDAAVSRLIDDAYIQWPHIYMNQRFPVPPPSPLPPRVSYHHLRVPGDVTLLLNAARVHRAGSTGRGIRVAMIDSGFAHSHPYFQENGYTSSVALAPGATFVARDGNGHGTGESANLLAIAPDATFIGIKLDDENDPFGGASVLEGFQTALTHNPQVISVSLGYDLCPTNPVTGRRTSNMHLTTLPNSLVALEAEIQAAVANGVVVVFSAGNGHVSFPGMMPEVISAGGVFVDERGAMLASDYASAFDSRIYPGRHVPDFCGLVGMAANHADYIMLPVESRCEIDRENSQHDRTGSRDAWGVFSGTSAAAPQLAGVCALLLEKNTGLTPDDVRNVLRRTCRDVVNGSANAASNENNGPLPAGPGADGATGAGLVDAFAAWQQV